MKKLSPEEYEDIMFALTGAVTQMADMAQAGMPNGAIVATGRRHIECLGESLSGLGVDDEEIDEYIDKVFTKADQIKREHPETHDPTSDFAEAFRVGPKLSEGVSLSPEEVIQRLLNDDPDPTLN